ncbi:MAG: hypothetical protein H0U49_08080 [Parachlamydiaceae bacterium]|nr:hypothetical protein [Parachlamydiaceae bacterium]
MSIASHLAVVRTAFEEFKVFVVQQVALHPVAAIAIAILFPAAIIGSCVWGIRKIRSLNQPELNTQTNKTTPEVKPNIPKVNLTPLVSPKASTQSWNKKHLALGGLAIFGLGLAIYCYSNYSFMDLKTSSLFKRTIGNANPTLPSTLPIIPEVEIGKIANCPIDTLKKFLNDGGSNSVTAKARFLEGTHGISCDNYLPWESNFIKYCDVYFRRKI